MMEKFYRNLPIGKGPDLTIILISRPEGDEMAENRPRTVGDNGACMIMATLIILSATKALTDPTESKPTRLIPPMGIKFRTLPDRTGQTAAAIHRIEYHSTSGNNYMYG